MLGYIIDEDLRSKELKNIFKENGYQITSIIKDICRCDFAYLGIKGMEFEESKFKEGSFVYTLIKNDKLFDTCKLQKINYQYLYSNQELVEGNTYLTSEALIGYMIIDNDISIHDSKILILGYGNCGADLAKKLKVLGAKITISNRGYNHQTDVLVGGYDYVTFNKISLTNYDFIINTVPVNILTKELLETRDSNTKIYDIASFPYGVAKANRISNYYILNSLPSKYAYKSAAKLIYKAMTKEGDINVKR